MNHNAVSSVHTRVVLYREKKTLSNIHESQGVSWDSRSVAYVTGVKSAIVIS